MIPKYKQWKLGVRNWTLSNKQKIRNCEYWATNNEYRATNYEYWWSNSEYYRTNSTEGQTENKKFWLHKAIKNQ